jgi:hypothetical protein
LLNGGRCDYNPREQKKPNSSTEFGTYIKRGVSNFLFLSFIALLQRTLLKPLPSTFHICCPNNTMSTGPFVLVDISARHSITLSKTHHALPYSLRATASNKPSEKCHNSTQLEARRQPSYPTCTVISRRKSSVGVTSRLTARPRNLQVAIRVRRDDILCSAVFFPATTIFLFSSQ